MLSFNSQNRHELSHRGGKIPSMVEFNNKEDAEDALLAEVRVMEISLWWKFSCIIGNNLSLTRDARKNKGSDTEADTCIWNASRLIFGKPQAVADSKWLGFTPWSKTVNPKSKAQGCHKLLPRGCKDCQADDVPIICVHWVSCPKHHLTVSDFLLCLCSTASCCGGRVILHQQHLLYFILFQKEDVHKYRISALSK